uniref:Threonyl-tRNA synthetase n=1 Tax=Brassica oleracea var. oleracea TaxID=109376 RepID=A0A0D3AXD3_BRAOL
MRAPPPLSARLGSAWAWAWVLSLKSWVLVITPNMYNIKLWGTSGHAEKYKKNTFTFDIEKQEAQTYELPWSLLDVPTQGSLIQRLADCGVLHRNEESGALSGLTVPASISLDDAHIFCTEDQVMDEVKAVLDFIDYASFTSRPGNYLGDLKTWDKAENDLKLALDAFGRKWQLSKGDGAFYGPKIDITVSDAMNRKFQCATLQLIICFLSAHYQLDFQLPDRFKLEYSDEDEGKKEKPRPVMIHRAVLGSVERMFAILLEHYKGKWPFWLSPRQAIVCRISKKSEEYALQVTTIREKKEIHEAGYYVDADVTERKIDKKVIKLMFLWCELVVGEIEAATG